MKKVLSHSKLSSSSKFVRKVLSRTSNTSHEESKNDQAQSSAKTAADTKDFETLELELTSLKDQISFLQIAVNNMQEDVDKKEKAMANMAREKQQLTIDLRKEKRSSSTLKQQLQDEREFYYKEKEQYCQEMNDCKKLKKKISGNLETSKTDVAQEESAEVIQYKNRISKLQEALNQTLEANYNLSVKFMRMKNTKSTLKSVLKQQETDHMQAMQKLQTTVNNIKNDLAEVIDKKFAIPISPSNKKYLQIIKQNGVLLHDNLCLQMEVDRLAAEVKHYKYSQSHKQGRRKPKQLLNIPRANANLNQIMPIETPKESETTLKATKQLKSPKYKRATSHKNAKKSTTSKLSDSKASVITIFERKESSQMPETATSQYSSEQTAPEQPKMESASVSLTTSRQRVKPSLNGSEVITIFERNESSQMPETATTQYSSEQTAPEQPKMESASVSRTTSKQRVKSPNGSEVCTESSNFTYASSSRETLRTQSAPEIVQSSLFVSKHKP